jgi:mannose-6-phosphate isomerase-like protein (cupin superfamily)
MRQTITRRLWFLDTLVSVAVSHDDSEDGVSVIESVMPRGDSPPLHVHHAEDEIWHIQEGEFRFRIGDRDVTAGPGDTVLGPRGIPHTYRIESERGRCLVITSGGDFERFVRAFSRPAETDGLPAPSGPPTPEAAEALGAAAMEYGIELVGPPLH